LELADRDTPYRGPPEGEEIRQGQGTVPTTPAAFEKLPGVPETGSRSSGETLPFALAAI